MAVSINTDSSTVEATRTLRHSGSSVVLTIPPQVLESLGMDAGDDVRIVGNWEDGTIEITPV